MSSLNPCNLPGIRSIVPEFLTGYRTETTHDGKTAEERLAAKKEAKVSALTALVLHMSRSSKLIDL